MRSSGVVLNTFTVVGVLVRAAGSGNLSLARCVHGLVRKYKPEQDPIAGTALLDSYARCASAFDSRRVFEGMKNASLISNNAVIAGPVHNELLEGAVLLFNRFRRNGMLPGKLTDAVGLPSKFLDKAGPSVWKALLSGCTLNQNVELGELAARRLSETEEKGCDAL
ncbi:hypothetical protein CDL15_Pgr019683 [Punica granatum]|uniref:Pentatricopeptide repeat-containing protein n=1 Tax=Punica granatum TaxID=22663 RepID=A0A218X648_PUNGR|nr:hypothetical protein CDL15_Pgr019683 [Punica granatum]